MMRKILLSILLGMNFLGATGQQFPLYNQHFVNGNLHNPANFGQNDYTQIFGMFRQQWTGIQNAPQTQFLTVDGPINDRVGVGMILINDSENILSRTTFMGTFSYSVPLSEDHGIAFGISLGVLQNRIDFDKVNSQQQVFDNSLFSGRENNSSAEASAGIRYKFKGLRAGFGAHDLFASRFDYENNDGTESLAFELVRQYIASASYRFDVLPKISIEPKVLIRATQGLPSQLEANAIFTYDNNIWAGATYRETENWAFSLGTFVYDKITIGYSYEMNTGSFGDNSGESHEFVVGYRFGKKEKVQEPVVVQPPVSTQPDYSDYAKLQQEKIDQLTQQVDRLENEMKKDEAIIQYEQQKIEELQKIIAAQRMETLQLIQRTSVDPEKEDFENSSSAYYVVVGSFDELTNAKNYQKLLIRTHELQTSIIQNNDDTHYLVYTLSSNNKETLLDAVEFVKKLNSSIIQGTPWIYKHD